MMTSSAALARFGRARLRIADAHLGLVFTGLAAIALLPVFLVRVAPLSDYINHLARMHVIAVGAGDPALSAFYSIEWQLLPNLAMDLLVPPLARVMDICVAGQIFLAAVLLLLASGPMAVTYAVYRRFNAWPLVAFLVLYNQVFLVGLANYLMGAGIATWGLAAWIMLRERSLWLRIAVSAGFVALTFLCHLSALGLYGLAIGSYELWHWHARGRRFDRRILVDLAALIVPALPVVPALLASATWGLADELSWNAEGKLDALFMIVRAYADALDIGLMVLVGLALAWAVRRRLVSFHPAALVFAVVGGTAFLLMPTVLFGSYMADQRLPIALCLMLVGFGRLDHRDAGVRAGFLTLVIAFTAIRSADVGVHWLHLARGHEDVRVALAQVERGARFLVAYADEPQGSQLEQDALSHAPCAAIIERSGLVSTAFTVPGKQIMRARPAFRDRVDTEDGTPPSVSQLVAATLVDDIADGRYWNDWQLKHDYLFILHTEAGQTNPDPELLDLVHDGAGFQLYRIIR